MAASERTTCACSHVLFMNFLKEKVKGVGAFCEHKPIGSLGYRLVAI